MHTSVIKHSSKRNTIRNHKVASLLVISLLILCLTGCGKDKDLEAYKANIETFAVNIAEINDNINSIDMTSETRVADFLTYLDALNEAFTWFAELEVPEQFSSIESLADDAGTYMAEAVSLYHQAFETTPLDTTILDAAAENYKRANTRIDYIAAILQGEVPEGEGVSVESGN